MRGARGGRRTARRELGLPPLHDLRSRFCQGGGAPNLRSDGLNLYIGAVENAFGADADYAQPVKPWSRARTKQRYSRGGLKVGDPTLVNLAAIAAIVTAIVVVGQTVWPFVRERQQFFMSALVFCCIAFYLLNTSCRIQRNGNAYDALEERVDILEEACRRD